MSTREALSSWGIIQYKNALITPVPFLLSFVDVKHEVLLGSHPKGLDAFRCIPWESGACISDCLKLL